MKQRVRLILSVLFVIMVWHTSTVAATADEALRFGRFGTVTVYRQSPHPPHVVLFVSGDGGWNQGVVDMAKELSTL